MISLCLDVFELLIAPGKFFTFLGFCAKSLDDLFSQKAVFNLGIQFADLYALLSKDGAQFQVEHRRDDHHQRHAEEQEDGQRHTAGAENGETDNDFQRSDEKFFGTVMGKFGDFKEVVGDASHNLPDFCIGIVGVAQALQMGKSIATHVGFNVNAHDMAHIGHVVLSCRVNEPQDEIQQCQLHDEGDCQSGSVLDGCVGDSAQN